MVFDPDWKDKQEQRQQEVMNNMLIYLASPYSSNKPTPEERRLELQLRYEEISKITASLLRQGYHVYSPIVHCHELAKNYGLPTEWGYWQNHLKVFLKHCDALWIIKMEGWEKSVGISEELLEARNLQLSVAYINPSDIFMNEASVGS
jgi:hypothetical protein